MITFLGGLHHSGLFRPSLVICPATVLRQWLRELRAWYPLFRVAILHESVRSGATSGARPAKRQLIQDIGQVSGRWGVAGGGCWTKAGYRLQVMGG